MITPEMLENAIKEAASSFSGDAMQAIMDDKQAVYNVNVRRSLALLSMLQDGHCLARLADKLSQRVSIGEASGVAFG